MTSKIQLKRTSNPATAFPTLAQGECAFNLANLQLAVGTAGGNATVIAVRFFSANAVYATGDFVVNAGTLLRAINPNGPGVFNSGDWGGAAGGLSDAPSDGQKYARKDAAWVTFSPVDLQAQPETANDGLYYLGRNKTWVEAISSRIKRGVSSDVDADLTAVEATAAAAGALAATKIGDAPADGTLYARKDHGWTVVAGGGNVVGPGAIADNTFAFFNGTTGTVLKAVAAPSSTLITNSSTAPGTTVTDALTGLKTKTDTTDATVAGHTTTLGTLGTAATKNTGTGSGNVPILDGSGLLNTSVLPALAITDIFPAASQAVMLALTAQKGDIAIRSDLNKTFALSTNSPSTLADWLELKTPTDLVLSVAGLTGTITGSGLKTALAIVAADITNATTIGKNILTAADAAAVRTLLTLGAAALLSTGTATNNVVQYASANKLPAADGSDLTNLATVRAPDLWVREEQTSGTNAQTSSPANTYNTRTLNTAKRTIVGSLASNQITLPAGTYWGSARSSHTGSATAQNHKARFQNVSDSTTVDVSPGHTGQAFFGGDCIVSLLFTIAGSKTFELQHRCNVASVHLGEPSSFSDTEIYSEVQLWKL